MPREVIVTGGAGYQEYQRGREWLGTSRLARIQYPTNPRAGVGAVRQAVELLQKAHRKGLTTQPKAGK